jgi:Amt family ammonium transporter
VVSIGAFIGISSAIIWFVLKATMGLRLSDEHQEAGADISELGIRAYPYFREDRSEPIR